MAAGVSVGTTTCARSPAAAAYAAAALAAFPADGIATSSAPNSSARDTARQRPRSLKLPVGFWPSSFTQIR